MTDKIPDSFNWMINAPTTAVSDQLVASIVFTGNFSIETYNLMITVLKNLEYMLSSNPRIGVNLIVPNNWISEEHKEAYLKNHYPLVYGSLHSDN